MAITVNWSTTPWLITIPQSDCTLVSGTRYTITVNVLWQLLRDFADGPEGSAQKITYRRIQATSSTPPITEVNDPFYAAEFEDGAWSVDIIDGNTNFRDVEVKNTVSVGTNNTTGFINPTFLEFGLFSGRVYVDIGNTTGNAASGTGKTAAGSLIGTLQTPSSNLTDALSIANTQGLSIFAILGDATLPTGPDFSNKQFEGESQNRSLITVPAAATTSDCEYRNATITGTLDGNSLIDGCAVSTLSFVNGVLINSGLKEATITLGGGVQASIINCYSLVAGSGTPTISMGTSGQTMILRNYSGGIQIVDKTGTDEVSIDMASGRVFLEASITNGDIIVRGVGKLIDNTTGTAVVTNELLEGDKFQEMYTQIMTKVLTVARFLGLK